MQLIIKEKNKLRINKLFDWIIHMTGYTLVFILVTSIFDSIYIDNNHLILWSAIIVLLISILNKTVKPILITLTIPITGITLGLFYPCINVFILKLVDWLLKNHFTIKIERVLSCHCSSIIPHPCMVSRIRTGLWVNNGPSCFLKIWSGWSRGAYTAQQGAVFT